MINKKYCNECCFYVQSHFGNGGMDSYLTPEACRCYFEDSNHIKKCQYLVPSIANKNNNCGFWEKRSWRLFFYTPYKLVSYKTTRKA